MRVCTCCNPPTVISISSQENRLFARGMCFIRVPDDTVVCLGGGFEGQDCISEVVLEDAGLRWKNGHEWETPDGKSIALTRSYSICDKAA